MGKRFNVTGVCVPEMHYMVNISGKINKIEEMVEHGSYFTINRPRQYGKTTVLSILSKRLSERYAVIDTSFEGVSDRMFDSEELFCREIFNVFADSVEFVDSEFANVLRHHQKDIFDYNTLSREITEMIKELDKGIVLLIDEIDKNSNNRTFLKFLGLLRNKYLARNQGKDLTFQSVILSGVHDIKNLKLAIRDENDSRFNSPWNIAEDFRVDMSFSKFEIETMLTEYSNDTGIQFDKAAISEEIYRYTSGYPYLVSRICRIMDEILDRQWDLQGVEAAVKEILYEKSTLFDDVIKNIENNPEIKALIYEILVEGREINYNPDAYDKGIIYGLVVEKNRKMQVHNKLFEERIYNYMLAQQEMRALAAKFTGVDKRSIIENDKLDMEKTLLKFQEFMYEQYRQEDERFYETNGRLIFLAYLKPILNGRDFSFVEAQTRENRRMDVVITFGAQKFVVELKIWNGRKYEEKGLEQLAEYLEIQKLDAGYMIVYNFNSDKKYTAGWVEIKGRKIFELIV